MKKLALLALPLLFASCTTQGDLPENRPYTITLKNLAYTFDGTNYKMNEVEVDLFSVAGAPDIRSVDYTATLYDSTGGRAVYNNSVINPESGTLFGAAKGGYVCTSDANKGQPSCWMGSPDAVMTDTGPSQWPANRVFRFLVPIEWAIAHNTWKNVDDPQSNTATFNAEFTFTAVQTNGKKVIWKQRYQFVSPG